MSWVAEEVRGLLRLRTIRRKLIVTPAAKRIILEIRASSEPASVQQKKKLHHVEDPAKHKKEKIAKIQKEQKKRPTGPVGMTENELQKKRANLNHH